MARTSRPASPISRSYSSVAFFMTASRASAATTSAASVSERTIASPVPASFSVSSSSARDNCASSHVSDFMSDLSVKEPPSAKRSACTFAASLEESSIAWCADRVGLEYDITERLVLRSGNRAVSDKFEKREEMHDGVMSRSAARDLAPAGACRVRDTRLQTGNDIFKCQDRGHARFAELLYRRE